MLFLQDIEDITNTAIPLADTLLEIGTKQQDAQKILRSHQVLCEVARMGVWSVEVEALASDDNNRMKLKIV